MLPKIQKISSLQDNPYNQPKQQRENDKKKKQQKSEADSFEKALKLAIKNNK